MTASQRESGTASLPGQPHETVIGIVMSSVSGALADARGLGTPEKSNHRSCPRKICRACPKSPHQTLAHQSNTNERPCEQDQFVETMMPSHHRENNQRREHNQCQ